MAIGCGTVASQSPEVGGAPPKRWSVSGTASLVTLGDRHSEARVWTGLIAGALRSISKATPIPTMWSALLLGGPCAPVYRCATAAGDSGGRGVRLLGFGRQLSPPPP